MQNLTKKIVVICLLLFFFLRIMICVLSCSALDTQSEYCCDKYKSKQIRIPRC